MLPNILYCKFFTSPVGKLQLVASDKALLALFSKKYFRAANDELIEKNNHHILLKAEKQLEEYFIGKRKEFDLKLEMRGTVFQTKVWRQLQKIPYGKTISYGQQATLLGDIKKARAVGAANGRNPLLIIVPCHRVIGSSGALTGFGGGLDMKQNLLELEKRFI